jgi:hypothetical protein
LSTSQFSNRLEFKALALERRSQPFQFLN